MIGQRVGSRGPFVGSAVGSTSDDEGSNAGSWTVDAASGIAFPASAAEWSSFNSGKGLSTVNPVALQLCQESSGNLADSIGAMVLTASGTPAYGVAVSGYTRKGVKPTDNTADHFAAGAGVGPDPTSSSVAALFVTSFPAAPAAVRMLGGINFGATAGPRIYMDASGKLNLQDGGVVATSVNSHAAGVHPVFMVFNRTTGSVDLYTDIEHLAGTYSATTADALKGIGGASIALAATTMYLPWWSGAGAEAFTAAGSKALLTAMGYSVTGY